MARPRKTDIAALEAETKVIEAEVIKPKVKGFDLIIYKDGNEYNKISREGLRIFAESHQLDLKACEFIIDNIGVQYNGFTIKTA